MDSDVAKRYGLDWMAVPREQVERASRVEEMCLKAQDVAIERGFRISDLLSEIFELRKQLWEARNGR